MSFIYSLKKGADLAKISFNYHPTYVAYKDNKNGVIYPYNYV